MATQKEIQQLIQSIVPSAVNNGNPNTAYNNAPPTMDAEGNWFASNIPSAAAVNALTRAGVALPQNTWTPPAGSTVGTPSFNMPELGKWTPPEGWVPSTNPNPTLPPVTQRPPVDVPVTPAQRRAEERATGGRGPRRTPESQRFDPGLQLWASAPPMTRNILSNPRTVIPGEMRGQIWEGIKDLGGGISKAVTDFFTNEKGNFTLAGLLDVLAGPGNQVLDETGKIDWGGVAAMIGGKINPLLGLLIRFIDSKHESAAEKEEAAARRRMRELEQMGNRQPDLGSGSGLNHFGFGTPAPRGNFGNTGTVTVGPIENVGGGSGGGTLQFLTPAPAVKNLKRK